jgi:hypothetical protein
MMPEPFTPRASIPQFWRKIPESVPAALSARARAFFPYRISPIITAPTTLRAHSTIAHASGIHFAN